jgi:hypothetical protein
MIKRAQFDKLVKKLELVTRQGDHMFAWVEYEGRIIARTRRSEQHGDLPMQHSIRQQLKLSEEQLQAIIGCSLGREDYIKILHKKGLV